MMEAILEQVVLGLVQGGIYALCAVGVAMIFGVLDIVNMAQGEFVALGGYAAVLIISVLGGQPWLAVIFATAVAFVVGLAIYPALISPMKKRLGRKPPGSLFLVLTLGLSIVMQNLMVAIAGGDYYQVPNYVQNSLDLGFTYIGYQRLLSGGIAAVALVALFFFLRYHKEGRAMRAVSQNPDAAQSVGINLSRTYSLTMAVSTALAGLGGALMAPIITVYPSVGFLFTLKAFAIVILGGLGNIPGALVASLVLGVGESVSLLWIPAEWQSAIAFGIMVVVLLLKPQGLDKRKSI